MSLKTFAAKFNYKVLSTVLFGAVFAGILTGLILYSEKQEEWPVTFILCTAGCVLGCLIGIITTPYSTQDTDKLQNFSKMAGTFLSGYILAKLDKILEELMKPETFIHSLAGIRFVLTISFFIMSYIVVFVFRSYTRADDPAPVATTV